MEKWHFSCLFSKHTVLSPEKWMDCCKQKNMTTYPSPLSRSSISFLQTVFCLLIQWSSALLSTPDRNGFCPHFFPHKCHHCVCVIHVCVSLFVSMWQRILHETENKCFSDDSSSVRGKEVLWAKCQHQRAETKLTGCCFAGLAFST